MTSYLYPSGRFDTDPRLEEPAWWADATDTEIETAEWLDAVIADGEPEGER